MILAGCPERGIVLDPFFGAGTVGVVAQKLSRNWCGIELNPDYVKLASERIGHHGHNENIRSENITTAMFPAVDNSICHGVCDVGSEGGRLIFDIAA
jgi:DNA modification methylase